MNLFSDLDIVGPQISKIRTQTADVYYAGTNDDVTITMLFSHDSNNFEKCKTNALWNPDGDLLETVG